MKDLLTTRSTRNGTIQMGELIPELVAQYCTAGGVKLALPKSFLVSAKAQDPMEFERLLPIWNNQILHWQRRINHNLDHLFDECVGLIFIAV